MQTKLGLFCDKVIEAGWLAAAIIAPLYFNVISSRIFEPDKITLVRYIALLMILAWLVRLLESAISSEKLADKAESQSSPVVSLVAWLRTPLIIPTLLYVAVYLIATLFSIVPHLSLWGSYQRLQGTYSTLSYITIFLLLVQTMRTRAQVDRLITTVILCSVPASFYGILQHFGLDPLPWGGDTRSRVASVMGNAIFIAAYLIMVTPLTVARLVDRSLQGLPAANDQRRYLRAGRLVLPFAVGTALFALLFQGVSIYAMSTTRTGVILSPVDWAVLLAATGILVGAIVLAAVKRAFPPAVLEGALYALVIWVQLACLWYSQSRGPQLGLIAGLALFLFLYAVRRRLRALFITAVVLTVVVGGFLAVFNIEDGPLAFMRDVPGIGRLGRLFEEASGTSGTGTVRILIWEGAADMVRADPARTVIGYGPEAMHVGYNKFYPPDLAHYEARNASPDRSHNETWDALVFTGLLGLVIYLILFGAVFYYGLSYLGLIVQRIRWWLVGGYAVGIAVMCAAAIFAPSLWVAVSGMLIAALVGVYVVVFGALSFVRGLIRLEDNAQRDTWRDLILIGLLAAIIAHFVEIQFGIAIASTKTHFWLFAGLVVVVGYLLARSTMPAQAAVPATDQAMPKKARRKRPRPERRPAGRQPQGTAAWWLPIVPAGLIGAIIMTVLTADLFIPNQAIGANQEPQYVAIRLMIFVTWLILALIEVSQLMGHLKNSDVTHWGIAFLTYSLIGWGGVVAYMLAQRVLLEVNTAGLTMLGTRPDPDLSLILFYIWLFIMLLIVGLGLYLNVRSRPQRALQGWVALLYPLFALVIIAASVFLNLNVIRANMWFKQGEFLAEQRHDYTRAIYYYKEALKLAPREDWYYLFLGKAYLDLLPQVQDTTQRTALLRESEAELLKARQINPLNTDHTANLARLHRLGTRDYNQSLAYYRQAVELSPHNAQLFNELGQTYQILGQIDLAQQTYQHSLELDPLYINTYVLLGELYRSQGRITDTLTLYVNAIQTFETSVPYFKSSVVQLCTEVGRIYLEQNRYTEAIPWYEKAIALDPKSLPAHSALGYIYAQQSESLKKAGKDAEAQAQLSKALSEFEICVTLSPKDFTSQRNLASVYLQLGRKEEAIRAYLACAQINPKDVATRQTLATLYLQAGRPTEAIAQYEELVKLTPNDVATLMNLALLYRDTGQRTKALEMAQRALQLAPNDPQLQALVAELQKK